MSISTLQQTKVITQRFDAPDGARLEGYRKTGGYEALKKALAMTPDQIIDRICRYCSRISEPGTLVVLGRNSAGDSARPSTGAVTHAVLHHAHGPVAVIPE